MNHLNSIHHCIQFTVETKREGNLRFLDIDIYRRPNGSLGHRVYCKPTHTNLYLNARSHHHPSNKQAALSTLVHRARALCNENSLHAKSVFLRDVYRQKGYKDWQLDSSLNRHPNNSKPDIKPSSVTFLPYAGPIFNKISRVLARNSIKSVGLPHKKI
jgi:hypothetical protein